MVVSSHDLCGHESILFYKRGESNRIALPGMLPFRSRGTPACRCVKKSFSTQTHLNPFAASMHISVQRISQEGCSICRASSCTERLSPG